MTTITTLNEIPAKAQDITEPWHFWLPETFDPCSVLKSPLDQMLADAARAVVSTVVWKTVNRRTDDDDQFARLRTEYVRHITGTRQSTKILGALTENGQILVRDYYEVGVKPWGYQLVDRFVRDRCVPRRPVDPIVRDRIKAVMALQAAVQAQRRKPIDGALQRIQLGLTITDGADEILKECREAGKGFGQDALVEKIREGKYLYSVGSTGRRYNSITGLKRELRPFLRLDGVLMANVDLISCQPAMLALWIQLLLDQGKKTTLMGPVDVSSYKGTPALPMLPAPCVALVARVRVDADELARLLGVICNGGFYEFLGEAIGEPREVAKHQFLVDVLAKLRNYPSDVEDVFRAEFPSVFEFIRAVNAYSHRELIRGLQRMEAALVVETVAPHLVDKIPIITLHDAIFCRQGDKAIVQGAFQEVFDNLDFPIRMKVGSCSMGA